MKQLRCKECNGNLLIREGRFVCSNCGLESSIEILEQKERRAFTLEEVEKRKQTEVRKLGGTEIGKRSDKFSLQVYKLRKIQNRTSLGKKDRTLLKASNEIVRLVSVLKLPKIIKEEAYRLFVKAHNKGYLRGRGSISVSASLVYLSCRLHNIPINLEEIVKASPKYRRIITKDYRSIVRNLDIKLTLQNPIKLISQSCNKLNLDSSIQVQAIKLFQKHQRRLSSRKPRAVVSALIYYCLSETYGRRRERNNPKFPTQKEISEALKITEISLRNNVKLLEQLEGVDRNRIPIAFISKVEKEEDYHKKYYQEHRGKILARSNLYYRKKREVK